LSKRDQAPLWQRLAWFAGLWVAGILTVAAVAFVLRWVLIG